MSTGATDMAYLRAKGMQCYGIGPAIDVEDGPAILVDTATDLRHQALAHGLTRVDAILYTHSHADHIMGLDDVRRFNVMRVLGEESWAATTAAASRRGP